MTKKPTGLCIGNKLLCLLVLPLLGGAVACLSAGDSDGWTTLGEKHARAVEKYPRNEKEWSALVQARLEDEDLKAPEKRNAAEAALAGWRKNVEKPSPSFDMTTARVAHGCGDYEKAEEAWKRYLKQMPQDADAWELCAKTYEKTANWVKAAEAISKAIVLEPRVERYVARACMRIRQHGWEQAKSDIEQANKLDATRPDVQNLFPVFERSQNWLPQISALDAEIRDHADDCRLLLDRAQALKDICFGFDEVAADDIDAAFKLSPKSLRARFWKGILARERRKMEESPGMMIPHGRDFAGGFKTIDEEKDPEVRAKFLLSSGEPFAALGEVEKVEGSPARAMALHQLRRLPEAGKVARRSVELHPEDAMGWLALAYYEMDNGNSQEVLEVLKHYAKITSSKEADDLRVSALKNLGNK